MSLDAFHQFAVRVLREAARAQRNPLVELYMAANDAGLADDNARAVVDEEPRANRRAWMNVDACPRVRVFAHGARNQRDLPLVQDMRKTVHGNG